MKVHIAMQLNYWRGAIDSWPL